MKVDEKRKNSLQSRRDKNNRTRIFADERYFGSEDEAQLLNYLKATDKEVGLLINFGPKPELTRKVFSNSKK
jgi:hypothetical protein